MLKITITNKGATVRFWKLDGLEYLLPAPQAAYWHIIPIKQGAYFIGEI